MVSLAMSIGAATVETDTSVYSKDRGLIFIG
jgi:hypothetical protein